MDQPHTQAPLVEQRTLGGSGITISALGVGVWAWGDRGYWGYGKSYTVQDIKDAYRTSVDAGMTFFDTAEVYGMGRSERLLGRCIAWDKRPVVVASKFAPLPYRFSSQSLLRAIDASLERLGRETIDLYQVHWPYTVLRIDSLMDRMAQAVEQGKIRAVGVSNYTAAQMQRAHARLASHGIPLAANQVHYSILHRKPEHNGVLEACRRLGVALIAYSPLEQGLLTGKYSDGTPTAAGGRRVRKLARRASTPEVQRLVETLKTIAERYKKTPGQVSLNWLLCRDDLVIAIPGAKTGKQAVQNAGALGWRLSAEDVAQIAAVAP